MTWNEQFEARGFAQAFAQSFEQGRTEGQLLTLQAVLEQRFGAVSDAVKFRLAAATTDDLSDWTRRFFHANSPEELVGLDG